MYFINMPKNIFIVNTGYLLHPAFNNYNRDMIICGEFKVIANDEFECRNIIFNALNKLNRCIKPFIINLNIINDINIFNNLGINPYNTESQILSAYDKGNYWLA